MSTTENTTTGWTIDPTSGQVNNYNLILYNQASAPNVEAFVMVPDFSGGASVGINTYVGSYQQVNDRPLYGNSTNPSTNPGVYFFGFSIPAGTWLILNLTYTNYLADGTVIVDIVNLAIHNPIPPIVSSSSTGGFQWPDGRGPIGLFIYDNCCGNSFVPYHAGWSWSETHRDISQYTMHLAFSYHILQPDSFWIEPDFGGATLINSTMYNVTDQTLTLGNFLGTAANPITDDYNLYTYNFFIPFDAVLTFNLHYTYMQPGDSTVYTMTTPVTIFNDFDPSCSVLGYDLSSMSTTDLYVDSLADPRWTYTLRPCGGPLHNPSPCNAYAKACQSSGMSLGNGEPMYTEWSATSTGLQAVVGYGDATYCDRARGSVINYICNATATTAVITNVIEGPGCVYNFYVDTATVCSPA